MSVSPRSLLHQRPYERVMKRLLAETQSAREGGRLASIRILSRKFGVSTRTVHRAVGELMRQGRVRTEIGSGTFLLPKGPPRTSIHLAINAPLPGGSSRESWSDRIYTALLRAASRGPDRVLLHPLPSEDRDDEAANRRLLRVRREVDGLVDFHSSIHLAVLRAYEDAGKPVVHLLQTTPAMTANFVSTDYFEASRRLASALAATGRRRILLLLPPVEGSISRQLQLAGVANGLAEHPGLPVEYRVARVNAGEIDDGHRAAASFFLKGAWRPDAIYTNGDFLALGALRAAQERRLRVPESLSIIGGTGLDLAGTFCPGLTAIRQPFEKMGELLVTMACERIRHQGRPVPGFMLPLPFRGGRTTRPEENALLGLPSSR
ncbi:MAG: substrate-binding domain-containing protein [Verrucomicrobiae bacterium]|nr:substrate-binding domain-containing protein [Verrucomicrobiae bacterium]